MTLNRRCAVDVFWNLATLMDDFVLELPFSQLPADALWSGYLPKGSRVCLPLGRGRSLAEVTGAAARIVAAGMRPVVAVAAPDPAESRRFDRALGEFADIGARELVMVWPAAMSAAETLDGLTRVVHRCDPGGKGIRDIGVASGGHGVASGGHELSADLLRAFEDASAACIDSGVGVALLTSLVRSVEQVVEWEHSLRAASNLFRIRARLPGIAASPFRRTVPALLGMAAAAQTDPGCLISEVQFVLRGSAERTAAFANQIRRGNFVIEDSEYGYRLSMLRERKV
ncbi:MAG: hypothetical protein GEV04_20990 [Actinophytocola sp.]|nr:hypothetical protein [Actinophytocola sp.]